MGLDYSSILYAPVYDTLAVTVQLQAPDATAAVDIQAIDRSAGVITNYDTDIGGPMVEMMRPAVIFRRVDLDALFINIEEMDGAIIGMNGKTWRVESHRYLPSPGGEVDGQVMCVLIEGA
jgi:hypothetical protein